MCTDIIKFSTNSYDVAAKPWRILICALSRPVRRIPDFFETRFHIIPKINIIFHVTGYSPKKIPSLPLQCQGDYCCRGEWPARMFNGWPLGLWERAAKGRSLSLPGLEQLATALDRLAVCASTSPLAARAPSLPVRHSGVFNRTAVL